MKSRKDRNQEFEVEKIIGKRLIKKRLHYKVKWKDFPIRSATWEPIANLANAQGCVKAYEKQSNKEKAAKASLFHRCKKPSLNPKLIKSEENETTDEKCEGDKEGENKLLFSVPSSQKKIELHPHIVIYLSDKTELTADKKMKEPETRVSRITEIQMKEGEIIASVEEEDSNNEIVNKYSKNIKELRNTHPHLIIDFFINSIKEKKERNETEEDVQM